MASNKQPRMKMQTGFKEAPPFAGMHTPMLLQKAQLRRATYHTRVSSNFCVSGVLTNTALSNPGGSPPTNNSPWPPYGDTEFGARSLQRTATRARIARKTDLRSEVSSSTFALPSIKRTRQDSSSHSK